MMMLRIQECVRRVVLVAFYFGCVTGCSSVDKEIRFTGHSLTTLTVQRGRSVVIAASTYNIIYNSTKYSSCLVYITSTPTFSCGTISPDVFNYSSKPDLLYTHYGCDKDTESFDLAFSLMSSDHSVYTTEYFTIEVMVKSISDPILKPSHKISVPPDTDEALVTLKLSDHLGCEYAIVSPISLPYYGTVSGPVKQWLPCNSSQSLQYALNHYRQDQQEDRVMVAIRINSSITYEQIPVIISSSHDRRASCVLEDSIISVTFGCYTPLGIESLIAQNCSFARDWRVLITKGRFSAISLLASFSPFLTSSTFTLGQLQDGIVAYHRKSLLTTPQSYHYQYSIYDVYGKVLSNSSIVTVSSDIADHHIQIGTNAGIDVVEGQSAVVTIEVLDFLHHNCTNFTLNLIDSPHYGYFISARTNATLAEVTLQDLHEANVVFVHSGADNFRDRAIWEVRCSNNSIGQFVQPIQVIIKDDTPPYLSENSVLSVHSESILQLSQYHLQAHDVDSCDATLLYTIIRTAGRFYSSQEDAFANNNNSIKITQFTQQDIDHGNVWYRPPEDINIQQSDVVLFNVSDKSFPPNVLPNQNLTINIVVPYECPFCEAALDPERLSDIPVVETTGETNLSTVHFRPFTASHGWFAIHIVDPPQFGSVIPSNFTTDTLRDNQVVYKHEGINYECNDSFAFQMHNSTGAKVFGKMIVSIVKQKALHSVTLKIHTLEFSIIRPTVAAESIVITDAPICNEYILFIIESLPEFGKLYCSMRETQLSVGSWFSLRHLKDGLLSYHTAVSGNQNRSIYNDSFTFSLRSPLKNLTANGQRLVRYPIIYNLSDPMVTLNPPKTLYRCHENKFLYYYNLTISNINVISNVANDSELRIVINDGPFCGRLILNNTEVSEFTVLQLKMNQIAYVFNATQCNSGNYTDNFGFTIKIIGHTARPVKHYLHFYWSYVMVGQPKIEVNETDGIFNITVRRTGYLNQTSKVFCARGSFSGSFCNTCNQLKVAMFSPWQRVAFCSFTTENNKIAEGMSVKKFYVSLKHPEEAIITSGNVTVVYISDLEDYPILQFTGASPSAGRSSCTHEMIVKEGENAMLSARIERIGDSSKQVSVMCTTHEGSARSSRDYQERDKKRVTFAPGQVFAFCNVTILNDNEFEVREAFQLKLDRPRMLALINSSADTLCVYIDEDESDRPVASFNKTQMAFFKRNTNYTYHIPIHLSGKTDIPKTKVFYHTTLLPNDTANKDVDFQWYGAKSVEFTSIQEIAYGELLIIGTNTPENENKTLHLELTPGSNYQLGTPSVVTIIVQDSHRVLSFSTSSIAINETVGTFFLHLNRTGFLDFNFTLEAKPFSFNRPVKNLFLLRRINFPVNKSAITILGVVNDNNVYNQPQTVQYCLVSPQNKSDISEIGFVLQCINITVYDEEDYPTVTFKLANYMIHAPDYQQECSVLAVTVVYNGDISYISGSVQYTTIDDTAIAGKQYDESKGVLNFAIGEERKFIYIQICSHDIPSNQTKKFHVQIVKNDDSTRVATPSVTEVVILRKEPIVPFFHKEPLVLFSGTTPLPPDIHYDTTGQTFLVCVTPCDPLFPNHFNASFCREHGIDNSLTIYEWEISYNSGPFIPVTYTTFFASPHTQILDEFYLLPGSRVRCKATPVDVTGVAGYKRPSLAWEAVEKNRLHCVHSTATGAAIELHASSPFTGRLQDSIKLSGSVSTAGNAVPLLYSQHPSLSVLTYYPARSAGCVLLVGQAHHHHAHPGVGSVVATECGLEFELWMSLQELKEDCHATVNHGSKQTSVHLELELAHFYGNVSVGIELEQYRRQLNVSKNFPHERPLDHRNVSFSKYEAGFIKLLNVSLEDILTIKFQAFANFSGQYLANTSSAVSSSVNSGSSNQNISLFLEETEQSIHNCTQIWRLCLPNKLHSGSYNITLVPCVLPNHFIWSPSVMAYCVPMAPVTFQLYIPTGENVFPHFHTAETELVLLKRAKNGSHYVDWRFGFDDTVYGGIVVNTGQQQVNVSVAVQTILACTTMGGYVPQYQHKTSLSGCLTRTHFITDLYTILDVNGAHNDFDAQVVDDIENMQAVWGFKAAPLFNQQSATHWFIHIVYNEMQNNDVIDIIKHDVRLIHLETTSSSTDDDDVSTSVGWCQAAITIIIVLSVVVIVLFVLSLICWKWNKSKHGCLAVCYCFSDKSKASHLSVIRRSHRYRAEIQEIPHVLLPSTAIHVGMEKCTSTAIHSSSSANKRLTGSKKCIVETTM